ncbi:MAG TPA: ABC transporter substrate-binding protein, partial [Thermomicrobiales bacterium]|nr:ABC transporter substrate-binding protein [Thermomicrobiales bacterium]
MSDHLTRRTVLKGAAALGLAAPAAGGLWRLAPPASAQDDTIKIGNPYNLTGDYASIDNPAKDGSALAADEINAAGGVLGKQIELIVYDGKSDLPTLASITKKMVDEDKVVALAGLTDTSYMKAAGPVAQEAKIPFLDVGGTAPVITKIGDYIFMLPFGDNVQAAAGAEFAQEKGWKTTAMLVDEAMDYTKYLAKYFQERYESDDIGGKVLSRLAYNIGDTDFSAQLTQFKNLDPQPDFFFVSSNPGEIGTIIKQARDLGLKQPILGGDGYDTPLLAQLGGQTNPVNDVYFTTHQGIYGDSPETKAFKEGYAKKYGHAPESVFAALGYDGVKLMADAIKRAETTEGDKVRDALGATKGFKGVTGTISYENGSHIPSKSVALI